MIFTKYFSTLCIKALPLHIFLTKRAVETLRVVVVIESLHPAITSLDWEATRDALGGEELIPVLFTIWETILQVEWRVCKDLATVSTAEALWMEVCAHRLQTVPDNLPATLAALWSKISSVAILAVQFAFLLNKPNILQRFPARVHVADEVWRTPGPAQRSDEGASDLVVAAATHGDSHPWLLLLEHSPASPGSRHILTWTNTDHWV